MKRGLLANFTSPVLWVHIDILLEEDGRHMLVGPKRYREVRRDWLWSVTLMLKPVIVMIGERKPLGSLQGYDCLYFETLNECKDRLRRSVSVLEMVTLDESMISTQNDIAMWTPSTGRYSNGY